MYVFHELHVDDLALEAQPDQATWRAEAALVERVVQTFERRGQRVALRIRHPFAEAALRWEGADNPLARWEERGHEVGAHNHRRHLARAARAIAACGVRDNRGVVPGLIQSTRRRAAATAAATRHLGFRYCTDQVQHPAFPYVGLTPWRAAVDLSGPGSGPLVMIDVSVNPFDWGILRGEEGAETVQVHGIGADAFGRLGALLDLWLDLPRPHPVCHFGAPFHEHNLQRGPADPTPVEASFEALDGWLAALADRPVTPALPRDVYAAWVALEGEVDDPIPRWLPALRAIDPHDLRHDGPSWLRERLAPLGRGAAALGGAAKAARATVARPLRAAWGRVQALEGETCQVPVGPRRLRAVRFGPDDAQVVLIVALAGRLGGAALLLSPFGLLAPDLVSASQGGTALWCFDRSGTGASAAAGGLAPGGSHHRDDAAAVWAFAERSARERVGGAVRVGWLCYSAGVIAPLQALAETDPAFLIDAEGPADRLSLRPTRDAVDWGEHNHNRGLDAPGLAEREPYRLVAGLGGAYHRLQAAVDHQHGRCVLHAGLMLDAAVARGHGATHYNGRPVGPAGPRGRAADVAEQAWPGTLHRQGDRVGEVVRRVLAGR